MSTTMNDQMLIEEISIIRDCRNGWTDRYSVLVDRYSSLAYNLAYRVVGDSDVAKDMAQESFIAAYQGLYEFKLGSRFSTWLYTIIMNKCRDYLRAKKTDMSVNDLLELRPDHGPSPEEHAVSSQAKDILQEALDAIPLEYREVLVLKHIQELEYAEIAEMLNASIGALKVRAHRGREMLREKLEKAGVTHG